MYKTLCDITFGDTLDNVAVPIDRLRCVVLANYMLRNTTPNAPLKNNRFIYRIALLFVSLLNSTVHNVAINIFAPNAAVYGYSSERLLWHKMASFVRSGAE